MTPAHVSSRINIFVLASTVCFISVDFCNDRCSLGCYLTCFFLLDSGCFSVNCCHSGCINSGFFSGCSNWIKRPGCFTPDLFNSVCFLRCCYSFLPSRIGCQTSTILIFCGHSVCFNSGCFSCNCCFISGCFNSDQLGLDGCRGCSCLHNLGWFSCGCGCHFCHYSITVSLVRMNSPIRAAIHTLRVCIPVLVVCMIGNGEWNIGRKAGKA